MTALTTDRSLDQATAGALSSLQAPVDGGTKFYIGSSAAPLTATGMATLGGAVASTNACIGIAANQVDNSAGDDAALSVNLLQGMFSRVNSSGSPCVAATFGKIVYAEDDQTVRIASGATYPVLGVFMGFKADGTTPLVFVSAALNYLLSQGTLESDLASIVNGEGASKIGLEDAAGNLDAANVEAAIAEMFVLFASVTAAEGAALIGYEDVNSNTSETDVAGVLDELLVDATSTQGIIHVPLTSFVDPDGDPLIKFSGAPVPGSTIVDSKARVIKWGTHANPDLIHSQITIPPDFQDASDLVLHALMSKSGATLGDAVTLDVTGFFQTVGALHDADADVGGTTDALTGDATAKTVDEIILAIDAADTPAAPSSLSFSIQVTDGTLGTDDAFLHAVWFEYTKKKLTS